MKTLLFVLAVATVTLASPKDSQNYGRSTPAYKESSYDVPADYTFDYKVKDEASYVDLGHSETRKNDDTKGEYYVNHSDGGKQVVKYSVDGDLGYLATAEYKIGEVKNTPKYAPASQYKPEQRPKAQPQYSSSQTKERPEQPKVNVEVKSNYVPAAQPKTEQYYKPAPPSQPAEQKSEPKKVVVNEEKPKSRPEPARYTTERPRYNRPEPTKSTTEPPKNKPEQPKYATEAPKYRPETPKYTTESPKYTTESPKYEYETTEPQKSKPETSRYTTAAPKYRPQTTRYTTEAPKYRAEPTRYTTEAPKYKPEVPKYRPETPKYTTESQKSTTESPKYKSETPEPQKSKPETSRYTTAEAPKYRPQTTRYTTEAPKYRAEPTRYTTESPKYKPETQKAVPQPTKYTPEPPKYKPETPRYSDSLKYLSEEPTAEQSKYDAEPAKYKSEAPKYSSDVDSESPSYYKAERIRPQSQKATTSAKQTPSYVPTARPKSKLRPYRPTVEQTKPEQTEVMKDNRQNSEVKSARAEEMAKSKPVDVQASKHHHDKAHLHEQLEAVEDTLFREDVKDMTNLNEEKQMSQ